MTLITSHYNVDFDGFASMVAASKLYDDAVLYMPWNFSKAVKKFYTFYKHKFPVKKEKDIDFSKVDKIVVVDGMMRVVSPRLKKIIEKKNMEVVIYDHHYMEDKIESTNLRTIKVDYGACTTFLVEELINKNIEITKEEALLYMLGIFSDTGYFTYPTTKPEDMKIAAAMMGKGVNMKTFSDFLKDSFDTAQIKLFNRLVKNMQAFDIKGHKIIITFARFTEHIQQLADVTGQVMSMNSADAIVSVVQMENKIFLVGRSTDEKIDIRKIVSEFKGGGHKTAAAAVVPVKKGITIKKIKNDVYEGFIKSIEERYTVKDIMSSPVRAIAPGLTMDDAYKICLRFNNNGLPVVKDDNLVGFITKEDVEKGILHNLGNIPVSGYMSANVISVNEDDTVMDAQHSMLKNNIGHLPVVVGEKLTGIITRTDILEFLYQEKPMKKERIVFHEKNLNMKDAMAEKLDKETLNAIMKIGEYADEYGVNAYLVGGIVRDLFLQEKDLDIDITVEGDGMAFAKFLADKLGGSYKGFERFKTAKVFLTGGRRIDVTSARAEFYEYPAALPDIEFTPIRYDMYRRDFTINAMAIQINRAHFGKFSDYFNGYEDLKKKKIRTLYNMSFIDDPTRIIRALRFEQRYNFKIEENTLRFIKQTLKYNIFDSLSGERIRDEILIILDEASPLKGMKRMQKLDVLSKVNPKFTIDAVVESVFKKATKVTEQKYKTLVYFMVFIYNLSEDDAVKLIERLKLKNHWKKSILDGKKDEKKIYNGLQKKAVLNSKIYELLNSYSIETLLYFSAVIDSDYVANRIQNYIMNLKDIKIESTGRELQKAGIKEGPEYKIVLNKILAAKLDGKIKNKKDEIEFIIKHKAKKRK